MKHNKHLTLEDRIVIQKMYFAGKKISKIAKIIEKTYFTVWRELKRNKTRAYNAYEAHSKYLERRKNKVIKIERNINLFLYIIEKLLFFWSPEQISETLEIEFPFDKNMRVSHETVYLWLYKQKENNIELYKLLRRNHKKRQKRQNKYNYRCKIEDKKSIHDRCEEANNKIEFGHWEGDLVESKGRDAYIVTLVERKTGYTLSSKMENKKADICVKAISEAFGEIPNNMIKSITFDNGREFSEFKILEELLETEVYFADPYCSWQRGLNENTNGLIRQYLPKKKSFKSLTENCLQAMIKLLNKRPRKRLGFISPYEAIKKEIFAVQN